MGGSVLRGVLFPEAYMICLDKIMKRIVLIITVTGGLMGYLLNIMNVNYNLSGLYLCK